MWRVLLTASLLVLALISCDNDPMSAALQSAHPVKLTPMDNASAELMALSVSGELVAPRGLYHKIDQDLSRIEKQWGDSLEAWAQAAWCSVPEFTPIWNPSYLLIGLDSTTYESIRTGENELWNHLAAELRLETVRFVHFYGSDVWHAALKFEGRIHPFRAGEKYIGFPGATYVQTGAAPGDWPNCIPVFAGDYRFPKTRAYLYRMAFGDCPSGCMYSDFYYLKMDGNTAVLKGHLLHGHEGELPEWWTEEALPALMDFWNNSYWVWRRNG